MTHPFSPTTEIVWRPTPESVKRSHLQHFMEQHGIGSYTQLQQRSTEDIAWFTDAVLKYLDIQFQVPYSQVVDVAPGIQRPRWCVGAYLNIVFNCVDKWAARPETHDRKALIWEGEEGTTRSLTYGDLAAEVNRCANALRSLGLGKGDAIGLHMPMTPEICIALLAIAKIGAIILPLFSGYGASAIASRLSDAEAKALFTSDGLFRRGQVVPLKQVADQAIKDVSSLRHLIVLNRCGNAVSMEPGRDHWWHELIPTAVLRSILGAHPCRGCLDDHLHFRHDGQTKRSRAYPLQFSRESRSGYGIRYRRAGR